MAKIKKIVDGVVVEVDDNEMVKVIENGVVVERPKSEVNFQSQSTQPSPEKKSPIGSSTQGLQGLGGSSGGNLPSPLSASATPPETPFIGAGRLDAIKEDIAKPRNPLSEFEALSNDRLKFQLDSRAFESAGGNGLEIQLGRSGLDKLKPELDKRGAELDSLSQVVMPRAKQEAESFKKTIDASQFITKDVNGLPIADTEKLAEKAKERARKLGLPEDGHAWKFLWNEAKDHVSYEIVKPRIEKRAKELYAKKYGSSGEDPIQADMEAVTKAMGVEEKKIKAESVISSFANEAREAESLAAKEELSISLGGMTQEEYAESVNASYQSAVDELNRAYSQNLTPEGFAGDEMTFNAYKQDFEVIDKQHGEAWAKMIDANVQAVAGANRRYNRAVQAKADEIQRGLNAELEKDFKKAGSIVHGRMKDVYKQAYSEVAKNDEWAKRALDRSFASEFTLPYLSMVGSSVKAMGTSLGSQWMQIAGDFLESKYNIGSTEIEEWSDWFKDVRLALRSSGSLSGSMTTSMVPAVIVGAATGGAGAGVFGASLAGGTTAFMGETLDLSGRMYDDTFSETGDVALAAKRAKKVFDSQLLLAPTYSIEMLPFFGKFSGGVFKRFLKGAGMEYASETLLQEFPQSSFEKAIKADADLSEVCKYMTWEDLNKTAKNTVGVIPMGGGGQAYQAIKENQQSDLIDKNLEDNAKSIVAKLKLGKMSDSQVQESLLNIVANKGERQADAVVSAMLSSGEITYDQAGKLLSDVKAAVGLVEKAKELNLDSKSAYVFTNLRMKLRNKEAEAEADKDPVTAEIKQKGVAKLKKDLEDIFNGKDTRYVTMTFPNGSFNVLTYEEARKKMNEPGFAHAFKGGDVKLEAFGSEAQDITQELAAVIERKPATDTAPAPTETTAEMERRGTPVEIPAEVTPTKTVEQAEEVAPAQKEKYAITKKMESEILASNESYEMRAPLPLPASIPYTPNNEKKWFEDQAKEVKKEKAEAEAAIRKKYDAELQKADENASQSNKQTQAEPAKEAIPESYKTELAKSIGTDNDVEFVKIGNPYIDADIVNGEAVSGLPVSELENKKIIQQKLKDLYDDRDLEDGLAVKDLNEAIGFLESFLSQDEISEIENSTTQPQDNIKAKEPTAEPQAKFREEENSQGVDATEPIVSEQVLPDFKSVPTESVTTDEARFQGRESLDESRVQQIVNEFDERKLDPVIVWKDPKTGSTTVLSGHHRFEAIKRMGKENIPVREFVGTEQEAIDFARDSNVLGKQESPVERAARYRQLREGGLSEAELQRRARSAHGKEATFMLNLSRLEPKGKAMDAIRQFDESTDKSTRSRIEAVADWIGALKKVHPDVSKAQESEMFDYLMEVYSPKSGKGKISTRNQFVDVASAVIDKMKNNGAFNEDAVLNLANVAGKGSLEMEYDAKLEEAKQREADARKAIETRRAELVMVGTDPKKNEKKLTPSQIDRALVPYEDALRIAIREVGEIRATKETAIAGDRAQISLFDEIAEPTTPTDEITERRIERDLEESRGRQAKTTGDTGRGEAKPKTGTSAETEVDADIERMEAEAEKKAAERKALADRIRALKSPKDNLMMMPDFGITKKLYDAALDLIADQVEKNTAIGKAVQNAVAFIEEQLKGAPWNKKAFEESFQVFESVEPEPKKEAPKRESAPKGTSEKRYATRTVNALSELKGKEELEQAVRDLGLRQETVSWKKVQPIAAEVVEDVFSDPKDVDTKANDFYNEVLGTTNKDYIDNPQLSTLHALTFHMMLDRLSNEGLDALYTKYSSLFQGIGSGKGRFISAMQQDASPYALMNLKIRPIYEGMNEALNEVSETGSTRFEEIAKVKELLDELLTKDELIEAYRKKVGILAQRLEDASVNQTLGGTSTSKQSPKGKERVKAGRKLFMEGLREARGQLSAGLPINEKMLNGVKEIIAGLIEEGMYEASRLKKAIMKDVNEQLKGQPDAIIDLAAAIDTYLQSKEFDESRKETMKAAFIESIENRAKSLMGNKRAAEKSAEQVLLDTLLQKVGQEIGKDAAKGSKAYEQRLKAALENLEFSDDVWKAAISNVRTWLEHQDMDPVQKAETLARLEDSASLFMENPFAKSDLRKAIRDGEKEIGIAVQDVVKKHWTSQNKLLESLAEKLVSELGLNAETAKKYEQAVMEEAKEYMNEKRLAAIREALNLDKNGMRKERSEKVNKRVIDRMIEAINLGILDDNAFRGLFAEKYGIVNLTPKDIRMMKHLNDLINIHEGTDISRRYTKELADYIETLKPWTATRVMMAWQGMTIKGMLTGASTIAVNIPIGSLYSFTAATLPAVISNPVAFSAFMSEYNKAGLSKTGLKTFWDVLVDGYSPQEDGLGSKYDERDVYGDPIDYMIRNYDKEKLWKEVREAKSPKDAAKKFGMMVVKGYLQVYRLANFAKAFDVLLSTRGVEFDLFLKYWNEESKAAGHPLRGKFDPNVSKDFIDKVRAKMAYDPETRKDIEASVDEQIAGMKARGERVGISYRQTLIREAMIAQRSMEDYKRAKERVASYLLMEQPTGLLSYAYDPLTKTMAIKEDNNPVAAAAKLGFNLTLGLFLRISITAAQRGMENIPIAGLALPGILYDRVPSNALDPRSEKEWRSFLNKKFDREQMKRRLMTHASVAALAGLVAMNMFRLEDDEEEEEQEDGSFKVVKRTRIVENPNRVFDVTGFSGEFFKTEQFNEENTPRKDYYFRVKVGDKWHNAVPLRLAPHFLFPVSVLGGMSDDLKFNPNKDRRKRELLIESADDFMLAWSEMSFATIPKTTKSLYFGFQKGGGEGLMKVGEIVVRPARTAIYPNAYRDVYKESKFLLGSEEKLAQGMLAPLVNDFPFLEDYMGESTYDIFGYPKKVTSKLIQSAEDAPGAGMLVDSFLDYSAKNEDRFESPAWQKKMKYFPNVEIQGYWPNGFEYETKVRASQIYGEILRKDIEAFSEEKLEEIGVENTAKVFDLWLNGKLTYDGTRSGGRHREIVKEVQEQLKTGRLTEAQKDEFKLRNTIRAILEGNVPDGAKVPSMDTLLNKLGSTVEERKALEEELKPKKKKS